MAGSLGSNPSHNTRPADRWMTDRLKKAPGQGLETGGASIGRWARCRLRAPGGCRCAVPQPIEPGPGARLETQTAGAAGHCVGGAAQNAQALSVKVVNGRGCSGSSSYRALSGGCQIQGHGVLHLAVMAAILSAASDAGVSVRWQLCDSWTRFSDALACSLIRSSSCTLVLPKQPV